MSTSQTTENRLLLIEKVLLLKSLSMFADTPETILAEVAELLQEEEVTADTLVFSLGDTGESMYIICSGEVRIHHGDLTLAVLKERNVFGEYSLLDTDVRSASATVISDALLLKLDQEPFYELMESRIEVAKGIIKMLCRRLRNQNIMLAEQQGGR